MFFPEDMISVMFHLKNSCCVFIDIAACTYSFTTFTIKSCVHLSFEYKSYKNPCLHCKTQGFPGRINESLFMCLMVQLMHTVKWHSKFNMCVFL